MGLFDFFKKKKEDEETPITLSFDETAEQAETENLDKSVKPTPNTDFLEGKVEQSKAIFSLDSKTGGSAHKLYEKHGRLKDKDLRDISSYDAIIGLIVNTRANQVMSFGKRSAGKYDRGFILQEKVSIQENKHLSSEEKEREIKNRMHLADKISDFTVSCGTRNSLVKQKVFKGSDSYFKDCTLKEFLSAQTLNLLVFGRCATQIIRNKDGVPIMFRPLPIETIRRVIDQEDVSVDPSDDIARSSIEDIEEYEKIEKGRRPIAYVQRIDGKNVAFFTEDELKMTFLRKQAYEGLEGYPLAPIEQAYFTVTMHYYAQQYQQNAFTRGLASKGIINLKTQEGGVLSPDQIESFRKLFTNYVARNDNSATIPVISGPIETEFIELNATAKDMEFIKLYNNVVTVMCACFQISPQEIGFDNLTSSSPSLGEDSQQDQIVQGEERGLRQVVEILFSTLDEIVFETFPEARDLFHFHPIGLGQNTKEADLSLYKEELQTSGTFGKIWADSERIESFPFGGDVPTSPVFHSSVVPYMKMSEMRYYFFGEEDALEKPEYDFFLDASYNEAYQAEKYQTNLKQSQQEDIQLEQMQMQLDMQKEQMQVEQPPPEEEPTNEEPPPEEDPATQQELAMEAEKHEIEIAEAQQDMQHQEEKHAMEIEKLRNEPQKDQEKTFNKVNGKSSDLLKDIINNRPKSLKEQYEKNKKK